MIPSAQRTEIGGIPAYVADVPGPAMAALVFRVGQADETLPTRGLTHLVEHLALGHFARTDAISGYVDVIHTAAAAEGDPAEVGRRLREFAERFGDPPLDRLDVERRILAAEAGDKAPAPLNDLLALWYGARGPGLIAYVEKGLRHAVADDASKHAARWFTAGNAALALTSTAIDVGELALPPGPRRLPEQARPLDHRPLPAEDVSASDRVALSAPMPTGMVTSMLVTLLQRRAWATLRQERGIAYDVECGMRRVGPRQCLLHLTADVGPRDAAQAVQVALDEIDRLSRGDVTEADLREAVGDYERRARHAPMNPLLTSALRELVGEDVVLPQEVVTALAGVTRDEVAEVATQLSTTLIATLPRDRTSGVLPALRRNGELLTGTDHLPRRGADLDTPTLVVGREGVTASLPGLRLTVRYARCVAAERQPDGALALIGDDGDFVLVDPVAVEDGLKALARVEEALPDDVFIAAVDSSPEQDAAERARRQELLRHGKLRDVEPEERRSASGSASTSGRVVWSRNRDS